MNQCIAGMLGLATMLVFSCDNSGAHDQVASNTRDTVIIKSMQFEPAEMTVASGDTVVWINEDIVAHDVSSAPERTWFSDTLNRGDSFEKVIGDTLSYFCSIHPTMRGKIKLK